MSESHKPQAAAEGAARVRSDTVSVHYCMSLCLDIDLRVHLARPRIRVRLGSRIGGDD